MELNLKGHIVGDAQKVTLHSAVDIEGHHGDDGRFYLVDAARGKKKKKMMKKQVEEARRSKKERRSKLFITSFLSFYVLTDSSLTASFHFDSLSSRVTSEYDCWSVSEQPFGRLGHSTCGAK